MASKITILKGLPGSGKSTWARSETERQGSNTIRINKDDLRAMVYGNVKYRKRGDKREGLIIKLRDAMIDEALRAKKNVIVDDTNFNPVHEQRIRQLALRNMAYVEVKYFDTPLHECIANDLKRDRSVGETVIRNMHEQYVRPTLGVTQDPTNPDAVIFDLDGTLALIGSRDPYDASDCEYDELNRPVYLELMRYKMAGYKIIVCSGRNSKYLPQTDRWLGKHGIEPDLFLMRKEGDDRRDSIVKREMFMEHILPNYYVNVVFDDRQQVIDMWRDLGLVVFQVADGRF